MIFAPPQMPTSLSPAAARACSKGSLDPRHEGVRRSSLHGLRLPRLVGQYEHRHTERWRIPPRLEPGIEHPPADQNRSGGCVAFGDQLSIGIGLGAELPVGEPTGVVSL